MEFDVVVAAVKHHSRHFASTITRPAFIPLTSAAYFMESFAIYLAYSVIAELRNDAWALMADTWALMAPWLQTSLSSRAEVMASWTINRADQFLISWPYSLRIR
jgi:hypothetical protein